MSHSAKYTVKPGHLVLFYQNILHQVYASKLKTESTRLHFGLRFTDSNKPLFPLDDVFENFEPFRLPSGQDARMWPKLWWCNWPDKLEAMSKLYVPQLRVKRKLKKDPTIVKIIIPEVLKLPQNLEHNFNPYSDEERALYTPQPHKRMRKK